MSRELIAVTGPDAGTYLQGQLSQDVLALDVGASAPTLLLEPSGKLGYWFGVTRTGTDAFELDVDAGFGEAIMTRLQRFKIRTAAEIQRREGGRIDDVLPESDRIEAGIPKMGAEVADGVIPGELGQAVIDASVSFTKGCYTGQELVARVDSRGGNVPRHLRRLVIDAGEVPPEGAEVMVNDKMVGSITSSAWSATRGAPVALAFIARSVAPPARAELRWPGGTSSAEIGELPSSLAGS